MGFDITYVVAPHKYKDPERGIPTMPHLIKAVVLDVNMKSTPDHIAYADRKIEALTRTHTVDLSEVQYKGR
jgi:hypothetical protein